MSIQALRERRAELAKNARNVHEKNGETWNKESQAEFDGLMDQVNNVELSIKAQERLLQIDADKNFNTLGFKVNDASPKDQRKAAFATLLRKGESALNDEQRALIQNTMSTTTSSEGGFTLQTQIAKSVVDALKLFGGMRDVSDVFSTDQGDPMNFPTTDGTAEEGEIIAENQLATDLDASFGSVSLNVFKYSSKVITVPIELIQDSAIDIEALIINRIGKRIGRITNKHYTIGTGTSQPRGIVTASTAGKIGLTGQTTTVLYDDLIDLQHSVDASYRKNGKFMMSDLSLRNIRKIKDTQGRPIFVPGYEMNVPGGAPDMLLGAVLQVNNDMPVMAANAKSILYGDFTYYKIRDALGLTLYRFNDSAYAKKGQIGFLAWFRSGGNFIDVGGAVKHYANSAT